MTLAKLSAEDHPPARDVIDLVVKKLYQITRETTLDYAIRVGSLIIHYFYGGEMKTWRRKGPKTTSFRVLAGHPDLPMSASTLYRCVAIYELCERLGVVSKWNRITVSHLRLVLRLDEAEQRRLLAAANGERWSVQRLQAETEEVVRASTPRARPTGVKLTRYTRSLERIIRTSTSLLAELPEAELVMPGRYSDLREAVESSIRILEQARDLLGACAVARSPVIAGPELEAADESAA
ncbi:MAG TPA: hypothetical protein VK698_18115 [Kofleriaceae bacterium]|nr:hypothetical protein [Kofleriaceae bacterium]